MLTGPADTEQSEDTATSRRRPAWWMGRPGLVVLALVGLAGMLGAYRLLTPGPTHQEIVTFPPVRSGPAPGVEAEVQVQPPIGEADDPTTTDDPDDRLSGSDPVPTLYESLRAEPSTVYASDFSVLDPDWLVYDSPGHAGRGLRRPSAVTIEPVADTEAGSVLRITARMGEGVEAGELVSGGLALQRPRTYGTYVFRMRVAPDPDRGTSGVAILWPHSNEWPRDGELDMVETWINRDTRTPVETNIHSLALDAEPPFEASDDRLLTIRYDELDGTEWHTYRFEWRADRLVMTIDEGASRVLTVDPQRIPHWDMVPTFQLDAFPTPDRPDEDPVLRGEVTLEVDWLVVQE